MEYALRGEPANSQQAQTRVVLILVLMEYALRVMKWYKIWLILSVLILVLMEYALRDYASAHEALAAAGLNPCFNGICSAREI